MARRYRRSDHGFDLQMRVLHCLRDIADRRAIRQHDMDIDPKPLGMQALGIGDAVRPIERIMRWLGMQHHAAIGLDHVARGDQQLVNIVAFDPPSANIDFDLGDLASEPCARTADPHARDADIGHLFGPLDGIAHSIGGCRHVSDIAPADALRGAVAGAQHHHLASIGQASDHRRNAKRANVDGAEHAADPGRWHQFLSPAFLSPDRVARSASLAGSGFGALDLSAPDLSDAGFA